MSNEKVADFMLHLERPIEPLPVAQLAIALESIYLGNGDPKAIAGDMLKASGYKYYWNTVWHVKGMKTKMQMGQRIGPMTEAAARKLLNDPDKGFGWIEDIDGFVIEMKK